MTSKPSSETPDHSSANQDGGDEACETSQGRQMYLGQDELENGALGKLARRFPSDTFLWATVGSIILSASMKYSGRNSGANFVGEWAPTFLALGIYSKLMKVERAILHLR